MPTVDDPAPQPPLEPDAADCCGEGCVNCIFDAYEAALQRYSGDLAAWQMRQRERGSAPEVPLPRAGRKEER
jgi:hypothetical protein